MDGSSRTDTSDLRKGFPGAAILLLLLLCSVSTPAVLADSSGAATDLAHQRSLYQQAETALADGDRSRFLALRSQLSDYPLLGYLAYTDLMTRMPAVDSGEVDQFLQQFADTAAAPWLRQRWLNHLATRERWRDFIHYYRDSLKSVELACLHAYAQYQAGDRDTGIREGKSLWQVGRSQPKECDRIFDPLIAGDHIDDQTAWQRFTAALFDHQYRLANYASGFIDNPELRRRAELYLQVDRQPALILDYDRFQAPSTETTVLLLHGLTHLARSDARRALAAWNHYQQSHDFDAGIAAAITAALVKGLYSEGQQASADTLLLAAGQGVDPALLDWRLREFIEQSDWAGIVHWSAQLDDGHRQQDRIKYWRARALALLGQDPATTETLYGELRSERSYYGFLASEWLGQPYSMAHAPPAIDDEEIAALARTPAFRRIAELHYHGDHTWARREWRNALTGQEARQWLVAARLASRWNWHNQAIMSMIEAGFWDDIHTRFPVAFRAAFSAQAEATGIPVNLLLALSRQESAFNETAISPAGARGLMQLMPATARDTARRHNIRYRSSRDLAHPEKNILIGSRYYRQMLERFDTNRILATAAYNAGPRRVRAWRQRTAGRLPFDAWIETIPFQETRNYVQNVLAFSVIFAHHLGLDTPMLNSVEKQNLL